MERRTEAPGAVALAVAVFLSGAVLLGVEIVASRVLAPAFGSSLYVWGSLIGVVLTGLAIGYWVGGVLCRPVPDAVPPRSGRSRSVPCSCCSSRCSTAG